MQDRQAPRQTRRLSTLSALAVIGALGGALGLGGCTLRGSGVEATEVRELQSFDTIELGGVFDLTVHVDPNVEQKVEIRADDNIASEVLTKVSGDELEISIDHWMVRPKLPIEVEVWLPELVEIDASGASDIEVFGLHGDEFELEVSGAAEVELNGAVDRFVLESSGASEVDAKHLEAKAVEIDLSGAGDASVFASDSLDVDISGAGDVRYFGEPATVTKDISGAGEVEPG